MEEGSLPHPVLMSRIQESGIGFTTIDCIATCLGLIPSPRIPKELLFPKAVFI